MVTFVFILEYNFNEVLIFMNTRKLIIANWKMHKTVDDSKKFIDELISENKNFECKVVICPPFVALGAIIQKCHDSGIYVGAQNCHFEEKGAFTGEISALMLGSIGVDYVIIGHSERRTNFHETDAIINKKLKAVFKNHMTPILCVGETLEQRVNTGATDVVMSQIENAIDGLTSSEVANLVIAYEPVWAIGSGKTVTVDDASKICSKIRNFLCSNYGAEISGKMRIIYGGSLNEKNCKEFLKSDELNGCLIGGSSLNVESFSEILNITGELY